jgi:hypothetical protein
VSARARGPEVPQPPPPAPLPLPINSPSLLHSVSSLLPVPRTPNTNHAGFFVAQARGIYSAAGLNVRFVSPHTDGYNQTPASRECSLSFFFLFFFFSFILFLCHKPTIQKSGEVPHFLKSDCFFIHPFLSKFLIQIRTCFYQAWRAARPTWR